MESNALAQCERPREAIGGGAPHLRERWRDGERLIERDEAVKNLLGDRASIYVSKQDGIECRRIVADRPPVDAFISGRLPGGPAQAEESDQRGTADSRSRRERVAQSPPPPSALPMATNRCDEPDVPDSMTGATRSSDTSATASARIFVICLSPFRRLTAPTMGATCRRR